MKLFLRIVALACTLGFIMLSARARAESGAPPPPDEPSLHVRRPTLPIPTNGVLVLERDKYADATIEVHDAEGALIEGTLREITRNAGELIVWAPASPLEEGTLTVTLGVLENPDIAEVVTIAVVAAFDSEPPVLRSAPSATWQATPQLDADHCCLTPLGEQSGCFFVLQDCSIRVQPGFSTAASAAVLNQYLFRVVPTGTPTTSTDIPFHPFEDTHEVEFFAPADEYCIDIHALNLATQLIHTYADLEGCASHEIKEVGHNVSVEVGPQSLSIEQCLVPPPAFKSDWCEINSRVPPADARRAAHAGRRFSGRGAVDRSHRLSGHRGDAVLVVDRLPPLRPDRRRLLRKRQRRARRSRWIDACALRTLTTVLAALAAAPCARLPRARGQLAHLQRP